MATKPRRQSNLELLRFLSMFFVLTLHYIPTRDIIAPLSKDSALIDNLINIELRSLAFVGVNCFILISGYFGIKWKLKSIGNLIYKILLWSLVSFLFAKLLTPVMYGREYLYTYGNPLSNIFVLRWFIGAYLCLYIISPLLNAFIEKSTKQETLRYIIIFYICSTFLGWILKSSEFNEGMSALHLSGLYLVGAYLRKYHDRFTGFTAAKDLLIYLALGLLLLVVNLFCLQINFTKSPFGYLNPIVIIQSVYLFLFFSKLKINYSWLINLFAASAFSVYLFHTDICSRPIWYDLCAQINQCGRFASLLLFPLFFIAIFIFCIIVDAFGNRIYEKCTDCIARKKTVSAQQ